MPGRPKLLGTAALLYRLRTLRVRLRPRRGRLGPRPLPFKAATLHQKRPLLRSSFVPITDGNKERKRAAAARQTRRGARAPTPAARSQHNSDSRLAPDLTSGPRPQPQPEALRPRLWVLDSLPWPEFQLRLARGRGRGRLSGLLTGIRSVHRSTCPSSRSAYGPSCWLAVGSSRLERRGAKTGRR